ncbi:MAG: FG-GAP repeat domain-containing protein, partial [Thermoanaerobaculia bacterium]
MAVAFALLGGRPPATHDVAPPTLDIAFGAPSVVVNDTTTLSLTIHNNDAAALTGIAFTDVLPDGLFVTSVASNPCAFTIDTAFGSNRISVVNASVAASSSCAVSFNIRAITAGTKTNVWRVTAGNAPSVGPVSATVTVKPQANLTTCSTFDEPLTRPTGGVAGVFVAAGDFNEDSYPDLVIGGSAAASAAILINDQNGSFAAATRAGNTGNGPAHISVADLNHDGHLDLIITFRDDRNIGVVLGNGDGTFGAQTDHFVPGSSPFLFGGAVADFNGDGNLDFVVADQTSNSVTIFYGAGNGSLTVSPAIAMGNTPYEVVAADFNGDGIPDLATANGTAPAAFTVRLGTGGGSFGAANSFIGSGFGGLSMTVADFDGDGVLDAALVNFSNTSFTVFHGNGDGSFTAGVTYGVGTQPISIMSGDLDGDGNIDIATANEGSNNVTVRFGDGAGGFAESVTRIVDASLPASIAAADFHGIGKMDLATANINSFNVSVLA